MGPKIEMGGAGEVGVDLPGFRPCGRCSNCDKSKYQYKACAGDNCTRGNAGSQTGLLSIDQPISATKFGF